jgi:outer membrane receptor protein involved in Fe transport
MTSGTLFVRLPALSVGALAWLASALAQPAPAAAPKPEDVVQLSAFRVESDRDYGYRATNTMTATRTAAPIIETSLNIAVLTEDFFNDIGANFLNDGLKYVSSVSTTTLGNNGRIGGSGDGTKIRGFDIPFALRNGFRRSYNVTIRNLERVEVAKGPVSLLFGQTAPGGLINYITKKPKFVKNSGSVMLRVGDSSLLSGEVEAETAFDVFGTKGDDLAVRAMYATSSQDLERDYEFRDELYSMVQVAARPLAGLNLMFEFEHHDTKSNLAQGLPWGNNVYAKAVEDARAAGRTADYLRWFANRANWQNDIQVRTGTRPPAVDAFMVQAYPPGQFWTYNLSGPDTRFNARSNSIGFDADWKLNNQLTLRYGFNLYKVHYFEKFCFTDTPNADYSFGVAGFSSRNNTRVTTTHQTDAVYKLDFGSVKNTFVAGAEWINDYETNRRLFFDTTAIAVASGLNRATPPTGQADRGPALNGMFFYIPSNQPSLKIDVGITTFDRPQNKTITEHDRKGYYLTWRSQFLKDRVILQAGVRREEGETTVFAPFTGTRSFDLQKGTTPMFGANVRVLPGLVAFASYAESFVPSTARTATGALATPAEIQPLGPIEGKGYELGLKTDWRQNTLTGTISLFRVARTNEPAIDYTRTQNDPRNRDPSTPSGLRFPYDVTFLTGGGETATEGIDGDLVWSPQRNLQILANFTYAWTAEIVKGVDVNPGTGLRENGTSVVLGPISQNGSRLVRVPKFSGGLFGKYTFAEGDLKGFSVGAGMRHVGEHIIFFGGADFQKFTQKAYQIFDLNLGYETKLLGRRTHFALNVTNLFDKRVVDGTYTPNPGRHFVLTTRWKF